MVSIRGIFMQRGGREQRQKDKAKTPEEKVLTNPRNFFRG